MTIKSLTLLALLGTTVSSLTAMGPVVYRENFANGDSSREEGPTGWRAAVGGPPTSIFSYSNDNQIVPWYASNGGDTPGDLPGVNNNPVPVLDPADGSDHAIYTPKRNNVGIYTEEYNALMSNLVGFGFSNIFGSGATDVPEGTLADTKVALEVDDTWYLTASPVLSGQAGDGIWYRGEIDIWDTDWTLTDGTPAMFAPNGTLTNMGLYISSGLQAGNWGVDNVTLYGVPEPGTIALIVGGLGAVLLVAMRRRK